MDEIKITLETLYDVLRNEKKREDLQKLEGSFFIDVVSYLREKNALLEDKSADDDIFASGEKEKLEYELRSIKRILKEIYEKREKKIIDIALNRSRTRSDIIDTSGMLREEKDFYNQILSVLDGFRKGVLLNIFKCELPDVMGNKINLAVSKSKEKVEPKEVDKSIVKNELEETKLEKDPVSELEENELTKIKFIHPMPSFVWKDMKEYGPFDVGEELEIFSEVADLLVKKKRAEKV